jgi:Tat protein secretion system quality control protein TatD with DNase activity
VQGPEGGALVKPTTEHDFIRNKIAIFFIRDPRDILVSSYYSFGFTHGLSQVQSIREIQEKKRRGIREMTLDEYVLDAAEHQIDFFRTLYDLSNACERSVILRYEDMINDFDGFAEQLRRYVAIDTDAMQDIYQRSRPREAKDKASHRRSGQVEGFREKLEEGTIQAVKKKLANTLALFGYKA